MAQSTLMMIFSPITALLRDAYETKASIIDSNATIFFILTIIVNLPSVYLLESGSTSGEGMFKWFKKAALLTIIGQWGRYMTILMFPDQFWLTIIPAAVIALGGPFFFNGLCKFACVWFGDNERGMAIGILTIGIALGSLFGFSLAAFFVFDEDKEDHEKIKRQTEDFMFFVSLATTILCLPTIFLYRQKPKTFPSISAQESGNLIQKQNLSIMNELPLLWRNSNFKNTFLIFTIMNGSTNTFAAIIGFLIEPYGLNSTDASIMGITSVLCGFVSSIIFPIIMQKYQWYLKSMRVMVIGAGIAQISVTIALTMGSFVWSLLAIALFGLFNIPTTGIVYSYATEISYPVSEALLGCIFQSGSCFFSATITYLSLYLIEQWSASIVLLIFVIIYSICVYLVCQLTEDLRRLNLCKAPQDEPESYINTTD